MSEIEGWKWKQVPRTSNEADLGMLGSVGVGWNVLADGL